MTPQNHEQSNERQSRLIWGAILIAGGVLLLLPRLPIFSALTGMIWTTLFSAAGLTVLYFFFSDQERRWWAAIPGSALFGLAMVIAIGELGPHFLAPLSGPLFLFSLAVGFGLVFLAVPQHWWAIIPAGVMATLAAVAGVDALHLRWLDSGSLFFVGLGFTFLVLPLVAERAGRELRWAFIPGTILLLMGLLIGTPFLGVLGNLWPVALIVAGGLLIWRQMAAH
ncbi:MAG TPA: hypothetical protein PKE45_16815 [Caldilineaceae bacterium]|nr:hypothetical protein [Caldilineaceae bacterium]